MARTHGKADTEASSSDLETCPHLKRSTYKNDFVPLHPAAQQMIRNVEELSGKPVHDIEDPDLKVMATVAAARGEAPAHFLRYRPGVKSLDYLIVYQLGFVERQLAVAPDQRMEVVAFPEEKQAGIEALGLQDYPPDFAEAMVGNLVTQVRTYSVGCRVDDMIWNDVPELGAFASIRGLKVSPASPYQSGHNALPWFSGHPKSRSMRL
jgi:hypothetical protein